MAEKGRDSVERSEGTLTKIRGSQGKTEPTGKEGARNRWARWTERVYRRSRMKEDWRAGGLSVRRRRAEKPQKHMGGHQGPRRLRQLPSNIG